MRDKLQGVIQANHPGATFSFLAQEAHQVELARKLQEEVAEFLNADSREEKIEELADIYEVLESLIKSEKLNPSEIETKKLAKRQERGGFSSGLYWKN